MFTVKVESNDLLSRGIEYLTFYSVNDIAEMGLPALGTVIKHGKNYRKYIELPCTFDIETCTVNRKGENVGYMYVWQAAIFSEERVVIGRTWEEWLKLCSILSSRYDATIVIYVHNLPYEAVFLRDYINVVKAFATDVNKPIRLLTDQDIEYRCSYKLTNMSLDKLCEKSGVRYRKQHNYNYREVLTPSSKLSVSQLEYIYCDAAGLFESIKKRLDTHTLANIPHTSTGYVRERTREALSRNQDVNRAYFLNTKITAEVYDMCKLTRRGGNVHAQAYYSGKLIDNVKSRDKKSSYPYEMMTKLYPMRLRMDDPSTFEWHLIEGRAIVFEVVYENIYLRNPFDIPYLSVAKGHIKRNIVSDNGRLVSADMYACYMTECDYDIVERQYGYKNRHIIRMCTGEKAMFPREFRELIMEYFAEKEALTGVDAYMRDRKKNEINALFGMLLTDICHDEYVYLNRGNIGYETKKVCDIASDIEHYYKSMKNFAAYQQGIYVTAYARASLQEGLNLTGDDTIYTDTDCDKYIGEHEQEFECINARIRKEADTYDVKPYLSSGEYLGVWELEGEYDQFITCGAKKYGYTDSKGLHITVAGCSKKDGKNYIEAHDGLHAFERGRYEGYTIDADHSGRLTAYYNYWDKPRSIIVNNERIAVRSNIGLVPATYTLGITSEYDDYIKSVQKKYDFMQ